MTRFQSKHHYAWKILLVCCAIQAGALGAVSNCKGVFYDAICSELGLSLGAFTLQGVYAGIASAAATPLALRVLKRCRMNVVIFLACVGYAGIQFLMSFLGKKIGLWYGLAVVQAVAGSFLLFLPVPIIINRWFAMKKGLATSVAAIFSGLSGIILNPVYALITERCGWRTGYRFSAGICFLLIAPLALLILRSSPEEKGVQPYGMEQPGAEQAAQQPQSQKLDRQCLPTVFSMAIIAVCLSCGSSFQSHLTKYGISIGIPLQTSAFLPSVAMLGSVILKPVMGLCADRYGISRTALVFFICNTAGFVMLLFSQQIAPFLYLGALFCGISMAGNVVLYPLLVESSLHQYDFDQCYGYLSMVISMTGVTAGSLFGFLFDWSGAYLYSFIFLTTVALLNLFSLYRLTSGRKGE